MIGPLYYGSLIAVSIAAPVLAARISGIRWRYKLPACILLANVAPVLLVALASGGHIGSTFGVAILFGLFISTFLVLPISMFFKGRALQ